MSKLELSAEQASQPEQIMAVLDDFSGRLGFQNRHDLVRTYPDISMNEVIAVLYGGQTTPSAKAMIALVMTEASDATKAVETNEV